MTEFQQILSLFRLPYWAFRVWAWRKFTGATELHLSLSDKADTSTWDGRASIYRAVYRCVTSESKKEISNF